MALPTILRNQVSQGQGAVDDPSGRYAASAYAQLAHTARVVGETVRRREIKAGMEEGQTAFAIAAAEAEDGDAVVVPARKGGLLDFLGVKDEAYLQTVQTLQATRAERDAKRALMEIRGETFASPTAFEERARAWRAEYLSGLADPEVVAAADAEIGKLIDKGFEEVTAERQTADIKEARSGMDAKIASIESDMDALLREHGPAALEIDEFQRLNADREALLTIKSNNPLYAYSEDERFIDDDKFARRVETASLIPQLRAIYDREGYAAALETVDQVADRLGLDTPESVTLRSALRNELNLLQQVDAAKEAEERERESRRKEYLSDHKKTVERRLIDMLYDPDVSREEANRFLVDNQELFSGSEYANYRKQITGGSEGVPVSQFAQLRAQARDGLLSRDDLPELGLSQPQLNKLFEDVDKYQSSVAKAGNVVLDGAFKQGQFDFDQSFEAIGAEAKAEYDRWLDDSPEATPEQARARAREIAAERGRNLAVSKWSAFLDFDEAEPDESFARAEDEILDADMDEAQRATELRKLEQIRVLIGN